jgi:hypothetical protein
MRSNSRPARFHRLASGPILSLSRTIVHPQSAASNEGQVADQNGAVVVAIENKAFSRAITVGCWFSSKANHAELMALCPPSVETVSQTVGNQKWKEQES